MRGLLVFVVLCVLCSTSLKAQKNAVYLQLVGVDEAELKMNLVERFSNLEIAKKRLANKISTLRQSGYWEANLDSLYSGGDTLKAILHLGAKYNWENHEIFVDDSNYRAEIVVRGGQEWNNFNNSVQELVSYFGNHGYPFAQLVIERLSITDRVLAGKWVLVKGDFVSWDSIAVKGTLKVNRKVLQKYLGVKPGKMYKESVSLQISKRLNNLKYAREIKPSEIEFNQSKAKLYTYLEKRAANQFDGIIGFQQNKSKNLEVTGEVNLGLNNVFLAGEEIGLKWKKVEAESQNLAVKFTLPYLFGTSLGSELDFKLRKQDSTYLNTSFRVGIRVLQSGNNNLKLFWDRRSSSLVSTKHLEGATVLPSFADSKNNLWGIGGAFNTLDYLYNPMQGWKLRGNVGVGKHVIAKNRNLKEELYNGIDLEGVVLDASWHVEYNYPLGQKFSMRMLTKGGVVEASNLFANDLLRLGGLSTLRGFDEDFFRVNYFNVLSGEIRFIPERNTSFYMFWDGAYYKRDILEEEFSDQPWGVGFGLNFATRSGIFTLNYALGKQRNQDLDFQNAKIHFGYITRF